MFVIDRTVSITVTCDTCGTDWDGTRTEPQILSPEEAIGEPWRDQLTADGWQVTEEWVLTTNLTSTRVACPDCNAGRAPETRCPHCDTVLSRSTPTKQGAAA